MSLRPPRLALAAGVLAVVASCEPAPDGPAGASAVPMDTVDGTVVVRNGATGLWARGEAWRLEPEVRIGSAAGDGADAFGRITGVALGPEGDLFVLDGQAGEVRVFDRQGRLRRRFGGWGEGPGELAGASGMAWDDRGRLWVPERGNARYSVFDTAGSLVRTVPRPVRPWSDRQLWGYDGGGWFADELGTPPTGGRVLKGFARVDTTGALLDSVLFVGDPVTSDIRALARLPREVNPFATTPVFSLPRDGRVWFAMSDDYTLVQRTVGGDTVRIVETAHRSPTLSSEEEDLVAASLAAAGLDRSDFPLARQIVRWIHLLEDGHLLVQVEATTSDPGEEDRGRAFDVFDPEGRFLGTLEAPFVVDGEVAPASRGDELVLVTRDSLDVTYAVLVTLHRPDGQGPDRP